MSPSPETSGNKAPGFVEAPDYLVQFLPAMKRVRVQAGGETIVDSTRAMLMRETHHLPVYYFPQEDVRMDLLTKTAHSTY